MLDYDAEADRYDASRGGLARARAAASAFAALLPPDAHRIADVGAGTGIVSAELARRGLVGVGQGCGGPDPVYRVVALG